MNITIGLALLVVCATVYALIKRYETRLVLLTAGLVMTLIAMDPMAAFKQFDKPDFAGISYETPITDSSVAS